MPSELEQRLHQTQCKIKQMSIQMERLDQEYQNLLTELGVSAEQIDHYLSEPENFSQPIWEALQEEKKKLSEKLDFSLKNMTDPSKLKKTFSERGSIQPHWIYIR